MNITDEREALLQRGDELWSELAVALDASIDRALRPSTDWTGHDLYPHFARWCAHAAGETWRVLAGEASQPIEGEGHEINERWRAEDRPLAPEILRAQCADAREVLKTVVRSLSADQWRAFGSDCAQDVSASHIEPHLRMIGA